MEKLLKIILIIYFSTSPLGVLATDTTLSANCKFYLIPSSFVYHAYTQDGDLSQYLQNEFFAIGLKTDLFPFFDSVVLATFLNSHDARCLMIGGQKTYHSFNNRISFEGVYTYAGEFFIEAFEHCGDQGVYNTFKEVTGVGFAPYLYHGFEFDLHRHVSFDAGVILPGIVVASFQFNF